MKRPEPDALPDEEVAKRRDEVLRRMIATPPKPHKDEPPKRAGTAKRRKQKAKA